MTEELGSSAFRRGELLAEWQETLETERHFNDLLIRLRAIALPVVVAAAGLVSSLDLGREIRPPTWVSAAGLIVPGVLLASLLPVLRRREPKLDLEEKVPTPELKRCEALSYLLVALLLVAAGLIPLARAFCRDATWGGAGAEVQLGPALAWVALFLVGAIHVVDRHYYFRLLLGAVRRATILERALQFELTHSITLYTPATLAAMAITSLYLIPFVAGVCMLGVLLWVSVGAAPR